jgi:hypothetical protein
MQKVHFMYVYPGVPFYILCDYTRGGAIMAARACAELPRDAVRSSAAQWEDQVARMGRSGGRMDIVVVLVASGTRKVQHVTALRTNSSALNDELARSAASLPPGLDRTTVESMVHNRIDEALRERRDRGEDKIEWKYNVPSDLT